MTKEREQDCYQRLSTHEDLVDGIIDRFTEFFTGDVILHSTVVEQEECRPSPIAPSPYPLTPSRSPPANPIHGMTSTAFTSHVAPQTYGLIFATSTLIGSHDHLHPLNDPQSSHVTIQMHGLTLELFHLLDCCLSEHEDRIKSIHANHEKMIRSLHARHEERI